MKIQCDMCEEKEAAVYCTADEASLCHGCDRRVHHANKLAHRHPRFSLHHSSDQPPLCDICQEKRAFLFCKEDRAILCKECDISIHGANEHTQYHSRFLLAGVKLSKSSSCYDTSSDQTLCSSNGSSEIDSRKGSMDQNYRASANSPSANNHCEGVSMVAGSISEYLMETLPGWHIEELMNPSGSHPYGSYEGYDSGACALPFMAHDPDSNGDSGSFWSGNAANLVNSSSTMDDQIPRTSRFMFNEMENLEMYKDQFTYNPSSFNRPRQLW
ncbi:hypothetical protein R6Q59_021552 [Mikania micrantha]|uniref:B box-type domain-containing protein n=1 Tax=Mikania micrantha TaxID=192012 RepID=A0A5N6PMY9_9ASTR|nr:hypothetical protein E3N88_05373 [Mikania micrantha]